MLRCTCPCPPENPGHAPDEESGPAPCPPGPGTPSQAPICSFGAAVWEIVDGAGVCSLLTLEVGMTCEAYKKIYLFDQPCPDAIARALLMRPYPLGLTVAYPNQGKVTSPAQMLALTT